MATQNPAACHLLHMPREIRDQIYSEVLDTPPLAAPNCPTELDDCIEEDQGWGCGYYQKKMPPISCLSLLLCNRLISAEVIELITHKNNNEKTALRYKLDLMIWDCDIQPTWLSLPVPLKYVKVADVGIRFFRFGGPQWAGHPAVLPQYLFQLLRRFLTNGPLFIWPHSGPPLPSSYRPPQLDKVSITFISMLQKSSSSSSSSSTSSPSSINYHVLNFPGQHRSVKKFLKEEFNAYYRLSKYIRLLANSGLLFGKIKSLHLHYNGTKTTTTGSSGGVEGGEGGEEDTNDLDDGSTTTPSSSSEGGEEDEIDDDDGSLTRVFDVRNMGDISLIEGLSSGYGWGPVMEITQKLVDSGGVEYTDTLDCLPRDPNMPPIEAPDWDDDCQIGL